MKAWVGSYAVKLERNKECVRVHMERRAKECKASLASMMYIEIVRGMVRSYGKGREGKVEGSHEIPAWA